MSKNGRRSRRRADSVRGKASGQRGGRRGGQRRQGPGLRALAAWAAGGVVLVALIALVVRGGGASPEATAATIALAEENAGAPVEVYRGGVHTVLHTTEALPSARRPGTDPRPTLVWFSGTWCHFCERMSAFAHRTASQFTDDLRFVEKSVDHDRDAARRYGVRGTPTFVLIDAQGNELTRFHYQSDAAAFAAQIEAALSVVAASRQ